MPSRRSKKNCSRWGLTYQEKQHIQGAKSTRLGSDSQLPFGYCPLSTYPIEDAVVSPSGRLYSREALLEYLLFKTKEMKQQQHAFDQQHSRRQEETVAKQDDERSRDLSSFVDAQDISGLTKRKASEIEINQSYMESRKKVFDDTDDATKKEQLKKISPWIVNFTPSAADAEVKAPPKRPPSPFSGRPLRSKDLIPVDLVRENERSESSSSSSSDNSSSSSSSSSSSGSSSNGGAVKFICPVTRKTITNQKLFLIKTTGVLMIEAAYKDLAKPSMTCPLTGKPFTETDILEVISAASGFSASGIVEAKVRKTTIN